MLETIPSAALLGLEASRVPVEVALTRGTPMIQVVGLPESAVREGKERIRVAAWGKLPDERWRTAGRCGAPPTWRRWWPSCGARGR